MFEELAYQYADLSEANPRAVSLAIIAVGAVIAAFVTRSKTELRRAPYFALSGLLFLLLSVASMASGRLWSCWRSRGISG